MGEDNLKIELINKDSVLNALIPIMCEFSINPYIQGRIIGCVMNCPIAYDVDKVVEKLEEVSHWEEAIFDKDGYCNDNIWEVVYLDKAIEIVKNGGV